MQIEQVMAYVNRIKRELGFHEHTWTRWKKLNNTWYQARHCKTCHLHQERGLSEY